MTGEVQLWRNGLMSLYDGYKRLFECVKEEYSLDKYTCFVAMRGKKYNKLDGKEIPRLMIIGRAVNGWGREKLLYESADAFAESAYAGFRDTTRFETEWELKFCAESNYYSEYSKDSQTCRYFLNNSRFWNYSESIWRRLVGDRVIASEPRWLDYIAWSNLYKISPKQKGNPDNKLCAVQASACIDILLAEIEELNPTHILMMVGDKWLKWKKGDFTRIFTSGFCNIHEEKSEKNTAIVCRTFGGDKKKVVVTNRPERKNKEAFVNAVIDAFGSNIQNT